MCPPKGSHTALKYDLMKAGNQSLTEEDREDLKREAANIVLGSSTEEYVERITSIVNPSNIGRMYEGYLSVPRYHMMFLVSAAL